MKKSTFHIPKMDCPSEESLIRSKLAGTSGIHHLEFDLHKRMLCIYHKEAGKELQAALSELNLGSDLVRSEEAERVPVSENAHQRKLLWAVLAINFTFFVLEMSIGLISKSMGLIADSLDMLADAFVYGISLLAVGQGLIRQKRVAKTAGYFQMILATIGFAEVLRRFFSDVALPDYSTMIWVAALALLANALCLYLLQKSKSREQAHMRASMIFTSNDVIINLGVIAAGFLVNWLNSNLPDLLIGALVFLLVIKGAQRILKLAN